MVKRALLLVIPLVLAAVGGCLDGGGGGGPDEGVARPDALSADALGVSFETSKGPIVVELFRDEAPVTVANFVRYAHEGFYEGTIFHRVIDGFVIQGGGFTPDMEQKETHAPIPLDQNPELKNERGTLSMARTPNPHSATSQFFVNLKDNPSLDNPPNGGPGYAVFGKVVEGMDVVDAIAKVETGSEGRYSDVPKEDIVIESAAVHTPDGDSAVTAAAFLDTHVREPGEAFKVPFVVTNGWDAPREVAVEAVDADHAVEVPMGNPVSLPPGGTALVLVEVPADAPDGDVGVKATAAGSVVQANATLSTLAVNGNATSVEKGMKVKTRYLGLLDTGVPFDTNVGAVREQEGVRLAYGQGDRTSLLPVWTGDQKSPDEGYISVIPGFRDAMLGLHEGGTRVAYVAPDQGYRDGVDRWFLVEVVSIDG